MKPDIEKMIEVMISLLEEQENVKITYKIEKKAAQRGKSHEKKNDGENQRHCTYICDGNCNSTDICVNCNVWPK